ncbi:uncharacterized protein BDW47DRAFT_99720 [Aspergillus candidus]|uniref:Uncharacterized protein n=1 Tax=Aspergillus candidus TaxID=41067 RepID=A0A2I2FKS4_ASPCN|nr:hypothetical protein BDW47DRAFT_99720 [Aspergillus candidus]PLB41221.1 hypothetical protein BDW47DRAFT_99720 [Aspergillus candidus]
MSKSEEHISNMREKREILKISGTIWQETVDLSKIAQESSNSNPSPTQQTHTKPNTAIVIKLPCLAVRYSEKTYIRRFQIKFSLDRDYYTALSILSDIKCPFSESNVGTLVQPTRPSSSQWRRELLPAVSRSMSTFHPPPSLSNLSTTVDGVFQTHLPTSETHERTSSVTVGPSLPSSSGTGYTMTATTEHATAHHNSARHEQHPMPSRQAESPYFLSTSLAHASPQEEVPPRPSTATTVRAIRPLEELLPPKRDLPFANPAAKRACTTTARPATVAHGPGPSRGPICCTDSTNVGSRQTDLAGPVSSLDPWNTQVQPRPEPHNSKLLTLRYHHGAPNIPIDIATHLPPPTNNSICVTSPEQNTNGPSTEPKPPPSTTHKSPQQQQQHPNELTMLDLSSYLSEPTQQRTSKLQNWICEHIDDDSFLQLCQDVEGAWVRIALGK